ncbi:MAG: putative zinc-binding protein [Promethearchaeota archaeon]
MFRPKLVGIIACSGDNLIGGEVSRVAARMVVDKLRPNNTTVLCQPLLMAGDKQERTFPQRFPTITIEGCKEECSKFAVNKYSEADTAATFNVEDIMKAHPELIPNSIDDLGEDGMKLAEILAEEIAKKVDELIKNME